MFAEAEVLMIWSQLILKQLGSHAKASFARVPERQHHRRRYTSFTFLSGRLRIGLPVAAKTALSTAGVRQGLEMRDRGKGKTPGFRPRQTMDL
jgi:hypothetical protein